MSLTVKQFRRLIAVHNSNMAESHSAALHKRKLGYSFKQAFSQHKHIIENIVAEAILESNEPLSESSRVRIPEWIDENTFNLLIAKMKIYAGNYLQ